MSNNSFSKSLQKEMIELQNLFRLQKFKEIENETNKLLKKYPSNPDLQNILGVSLQAQGKLSESLKTFNELLKLEPNFYLAHYNLGNLFKELLNLDAAKTSYEKCIQFNSSYLKAYIGLGLIFLDQGKLQESKKIFEQAIKLSPENSEIHRYLSMVTKYKNESYHIKDMERIILNSNLSQNEQMNFSFALGKAYEDIKNYEKAFSYWEKANFLRRKEINYSTQYQKKLVNTVKEIFTKELFSKFENKGNLNNELIFIVGMPRSGTTLVQQILSSHPDIFGLGEKNDFFLIIKKNFFDNNYQLKQNLLNYDPENLKKIGDDFYEQVKKIINLFKVSKNYKYILVKDLLNFAWLGFIKLIFPKAKIIHCVRNPLDNCLSLYKNYFVGGVDFSYNLVELGEYYNLYKEIMLFWNKILPNYCIQISYEELLNNQSKETKKMLEACNLRWSEDCMNFHKFTHPMSTGSNSINVHKSIYKSSMHYWKLYEKQLKPLREVLNV